VKDRDKLLIGAIFIIIWIGFWRWADSTLPEDSKVEIEQSATPRDTCFNIISLKEKLEDSASRMAREANELQRTLLRARLTEIVNDEVLPVKDDRALSEYLSFDFRKLIKEKSDSLAKDLERNVELHPEAIRIVTKLIKSGHLEPYLFSEVQQMGQELRAKSQEARDLTKTHPHCFKSTSRIDKLIDEATKELEQLERYNGWIAKQTPEELINSIL
jgi:hypothetical protein